MKQETKAQWGFYGIVILIFIGFTIHLPQKEARTIAGILITEVKSGKSYKSPLAEEAIARNGFYYKYSIVRDWIYVEYEAR